jgi:hypothetical protein
VITGVCPSAFSLHVELNHTRTSGTLSLCSAFRFCSPLQLLPVLNGCAIRQTKFVRFALRSTSTDVPSLQLIHYRRLLSQSEDLQALFRAVINTEARWIAAYPYCGSFQPPPEGGLPPTHNPWHDGVKVHPEVNTRVVFECKVRPFFCSPVVSLKWLTRSSTN